jgi:apolipoprotein N-acyltransferase
VAPLICYDALAPRYPLAAIRHGAELILTLSNDSWFDTGPGPHLHLVGAAFRSIETRRPQIRATNTGISAVIDATGEITQTIDVHRRDALVATVRPVRTTGTLLVLWGDWLGPTALVLGVLLVGARGGGSPHARARGDARAPARRVRRRRECEDGGREECDDGRWR